MQSRSASLTRNSLCAEGGCPGERGFAAYSTKALCKTNLSKSDEERPPPHRVAEAGVSKDADSASLTFVTASCGTLVHRHAAGAKTGPENSSCEATGASGREELAAREGLLFSKERLRVCWHGPRQRPALSERKKPRLRRWNSVSEERGPAVEGY